MGGEVGFLVVFDIGPSWFMGLWRWLMYEGQEKRKLMVGSREVWNPRS